MNPDNTHISVAKKYARAFLNVTADSLQYEDIKQIEKVGLFIKSDISFALFLKLFMIENSTRKDEIASVLKGLGFPDSMEPLIKLLIKSKRLFLLADICNFMGIYFKRQHNISEFLITTSQPLLAEQQEKINRFLSAYTQGSIETTYEVDQALIAGVRMQSKTHIWEKSIAQQLRDVQLKNMR